MSTKVDIVNRSSMHRKKLLSLFPRIVLFFLDTDDA